MIAAVVNAARLCDPNVVKEFEVTMLVVVKTWAYDERDARKLVRLSHNWTDWLDTEPLRVVATGRVDG